MRFVVAQLGARMHYAVPRILAEQDSLAKLYTDIASIGAVGAAARVLSRTGNAGLRRLRDRSPEGIPEALIQQFPAFGLLYRLRTLNAASEEDKTAVSLWAGREFCRKVVARGFGDASAAYAFSSMAEGVLQATRERGLYGVLEQINAPRRLYDRYYLEEHEAWPGWETCAQRGEVSKEFIAREENEWRLADRIVCGSEFVAASLPPDAAAKCTVVPYGVNQSGTVPRRRRTSRDFNILFTGRVSLIKGIPYLVRALQRLHGRGIRCRIAGNVFLSATAQQEMRASAEVLGAVPRGTMRELYEWADVFVLPTLCEGSATVCYEALASGVPVITTPNAGSVVRDGIDGFIVPIRNVDALAGVIDRLITERELCEQFSRNALERSSEFTVKSYSERLRRVLFEESDGECATGPAMAGLRQSEVDARQVV